MSETGTQPAFVELVDRVVSGLVPPRRVTATEYAALTCNRCGRCCTDIFVPAGPERVAEMAEARDRSADDRRWLAGLVPVQPVAGGWQYTCRHVAQLPDGRTACAIHEQRPRVCRGFPFEREIRDWPECAWYVRVVDEGGTPP